MTQEISNSDDMIDVRDIIARVEELREWRDSINPEDDGLAHSLDAEDLSDLAMLESLLSDLKGNGGDKQWEDSWYPIGLIRDSYFVEAMQELVQDIGDLPKDIPGYLVIDWDATAGNLRADYSSVEFDGITYWYR